MNYIVKTSDNYEIKISEDMASFSNIWKMMMENCDPDEEEIVLPTSIRKDLMDKIVVFLNLATKETIGEIPKPLPHSSESFGSISGVPSWADNWLKNMSKEELQLMILCANFLDIQTLLHLCSAYVAYEIKGRTPDEIKEIWKGVSNNNPSIA